MGQLFQELRRRNVFKVGIAYLAAAWLLMQATEVLAPILQLPEWVPRFIFLLLVIGFVPALIFAWAYELTPDGLKRGKNVDRSKSITHITGRKLNIFIVGTLTLAVIAVIWLGTFRTPIEEQIREPSAAVEASIAVLPFVNMSTDPDQEYFADGMTEEILNTLVAIDGLRVAGRTSSFTFKGRSDVDLKTIGQMLGVANVLEGSVRRSGNKLRITAQLIAADSGFHLWSQTFDREMADIFDIQDEIATAIGEALQLELGVEVAQSIEARRLDNEESYEAWLLGWSQIRSGAYPDALDTFAKLIDMEPNYLPGYRAKVIAYVNLLGSGAIGEETYLKEVNEILESVARIDSNSSERYFIASIISAVQGDWQAAADAANKVVEVGGDAEVALIARYNALLIDGRNEQAMDLLKNYLVAEPLAHETRAYYAIGLASIGRLAEAEAELARLNQMVPDDASTLHLSFQFHAYFNNELAEGIKWLLESQTQIASIQGQEPLLMRLLIDLGDDAAAEKWLISDSAYIEFPYLKPRAKYFLARYRDNGANSLALARQIGERVVAMGSLGDAYLTDFDWLRYLQRHDPDFAITIYQKRSPQLTTTTPIVFAPDIALAISLADLHLQTGEADLANDLLSQCLALLEANPEHYQRPAKTMIYALKGDAPNALKTLRASIDANWRWEWWLLEKDPAYKVLWDEPDFKEMMNEIRADMARQREQLVAMIESGEIDLTPRKKND